VIYFPNLSFKDPDPQSFLAPQSLLAPQSFLAPQSLLTPQSLALLQSWVFLSVQDPQSWVFQSFFRPSNLEVQSLKDFQSWLLSAQSFLEDQADSQSAFLVSHSARVLDTQLLRSSCLEASQEWLLEALSCLASITPAKTNGTYLATRYEARLEAIRAEYKTLPRNIPALATQSPTTGAARTCTSEQCDSKELCLHVHF